MTGIPAQESVGRIEQTSARRIGQLFDLSISGRSAIPLTLLAGLIFLVYSAVLSPHSFGYYNDDAMYLSSAKSLATGHGYRQISLPFDIAQTKYPPLFPFLLSLVWRLRPDFPANLTALMMVAVVSSIAAALLTWIYFTRCKYTSRWMGLLIVGLAAINGTTISLSVGMFSEMVYAMFAVIALLLAETYEEKEKAPIVGILLGLAIGCAFLTRVTGITLLIAIGLYFLMRRKLRRAVVPLGVAFLFMLAWGLWTHHNRADIVEPNAVFYTDYMRYSYDLVRDAHIASHQPMLVVAGEMGWKNLVQLLGFWVPSQALGSYMNWLTFPSTELQPVLLRCILLLGLFFIGLGMRTDRMPRWRLLPIYVLLYIGIHLTLPYHFNTFDRYLAPILPFAILYFIRGLQESVRLTRWWARSMSPPLSRFANGLAILIALLLGGFALTSYALGLSNTLKYRKDDVVQRSYQDAAAFEWIKANTPESAVIATVQHSMYYMYTGRKATLCFATEGPREITTAWHLEQLREIIARNKVDYIVLSASDVTSQAGGVNYNSVLGQLIKSHAVALVFMPPDKRCAIFQCLPNQRPQSPSAPG